MAGRSKGRSWRQKLHAFLSLPVECGVGGSVWRFALLSVAVHVILFAAVFDIYFTSPLVTGIGRRFQAPLSKPPAARLVLIVSDGLRAHSLFDGGMAGTPFLRSVALEKGTWGVSHTRVPTESRPGHVAIIAGIYEDVASVARGWRENPVDFDSVFNRSAGTWAWGSPDIVPMFARGAVPGRVQLDTYSAALEDFARGGSAALDTWVLDRVKKFLRDTNDGDWALAERLRRGEGFVFFMHLLGMDTSGHGDKPGSLAFNKTLDAVDKTVRAVEALFEKFFHHDERTAYLFTSDHGMTDWGSHGAGHDHETLTPLLLWGAGVRQPQGRVKGESFALDWAIPRRRQDVSQADICPLMAALLNLEFPANSVGRLPLELLNVTAADAALLTRANAMQMLEQFRLKRRRVKDASLVAFFKEAPSLSPSKIEDRLRQAAHAEISGSVNRIIEIFEQLRQDALEGLYFFHQYDRLFSGFCVSAIFLLWMASLCLSISARLGYVFAADLSRWEAAFFGVLLAVQVGVLAIELRPLLQWLYRLGPVLLIWGLWRQRHLVRGAQLSFRGFLDALVVLWGMELLVWSFFYRSLLTAAVLLNTGWVLALHWRRSAALFVFGLASVALAAFPAFPVISGQLSPSVVLLGPFFSASALLFFVTRSSWRPPRAALLLKGQVGLLFWACAAHKLTHMSIAANRGLPTVLQVANWLTLAACPLLVLAVRRTEARSDVVLLSLATAVSTVYCLLSVFYEPLFLLALGVSVHAWVILESEVRHQQHSPLLRRCFTFMLFMVLSFFGTGNIASINSFDPQAVYCFLTVFHPFLMGGLMLLKIVLPMLLVACLFTPLVAEVPITQLSRVTMILADFMALHFFFLIRDWGSWLDIGTSISHYVISMALTVVVAVFVAAGRLLLAGDRDGLVMKDS